MRSPITSLRMVILTRSIKVCEHARRPVNTDGTLAQVDLYSLQ